ncbi:hypothetical protein IV80_GL000422 [Pediococcus cellicola]|uniref:Uncharacterized protein n=3 Tax=Pediococcus cellicola TaxID=319652 RepID=A0A0R2IUK6_9LACO|nr:hypothetical protein IV80_GL000422 [Pediococcus cellicola]
MEPDGKYSIKKFDTRYMDVKDPVRQIYHAAIFDCDDEPTVIDDFIKSLDDKVKTTA